VGFLSGNRVPISLIDSPRQAFAVAATGIDQRQLNTMRPALEHLAIGGRLCNDDAQPARYGQQDLDAHRNASHY
jgi:hypothetical protein